MVAKKIEFRRLIYGGDIGAEHDIVITITIEPQIEQPRRASTKEDQERIETSIKEREEALKSAASLAAYIEKHYGKKDTDDFGISKSPQGYIVWLLKYWGSAEFKQLLNDFKPWGAEYVKGPNGSYIAISREKKERGKK